MEVVKLDGMNRELAPPGGWDPEKHGECVPLPVFAEVHEGALVLTSAWKPNDEELKHLAAGGHVACVVYGGVHPPIAIGVFPAQDLASYNKQTLTVKVDASEAQAQGGGEVWNRERIEAVASRVVRAGDKEAADLILDLLEACIEAEQERIDTAPPSAPVGVEGGLLERLDAIHRQVFGKPYPTEALAQQPASNVVKEPRCDCKYCCPSCSRCYRCATMVINGRCESEAERNGRQMREGAANRENKE